MRRIVALAAIVALVGCATARAESCFQNGENQHATLRGTIVQSVTLEKNDGTGEPANHKFLAVALDKPICFGFDPSSTDSKEGEWASLVKAPAVPIKWLGHHVAITGDLVLDEDLSITVEHIKDAALDTGDAPANVNNAPASASTDLEKLSCNDVTRKGWDNMPDVTDYVEAQPGADKLGFGSPCHIDSLVFSQCWLEPKWSVLKAINALLRKAATGKKLPDVPICGA
jgi:hypothetical protein